MSTDIFEELVIYVLTYPGVDTCHRHGLIGTLEAHGADVRTRFGKDVTHVVVQQTHSPSKEDKAAGDAQLRGVFDKISKSQEIVQTVSMGWVQKCLECQRRVMERPYALQRPQEPILPPRKSPATAGRSAKKRRTRAGTAAAAGTSKKVAEAAALDVNEPWFSSSQQLQDLHNTATAVAAPAAKQLPQDLSPGRQPRNIRVVFSDQLQQQQQPPPSYPVASAAAVPVAFQPRTLGPATQYAADILDQLPDSALQGSEFAGFGGVVPHWRTHQQQATAAEELQPDLIGRQQQGHDLSEDVIEDSDDELVDLTRKSTAALPRHAAAPPTATGMPSDAAAQQKHSVDTKQQAAAGAAVVNSSRLPSAIKSNTPCQQRDVSITPPAAVAAVQSLGKAAPVAAATTASAGKQSAGLSAKAALTGLGKATSSSKRKRSSLLSRRSGLFTPPAVVSTPHQQQQQQQQEERCAAVATDADATVVVSPVTHLVVLQQQQQQRRSVAVTPPALDKASVADFTFVANPTVQTKKRRCAHTPGTAVDDKAAAEACSRGQVAPRGTPKLGHARATAASSPAPAAAVSAGAEPPTSSRKRTREECTTAAEANAALGTGYTPDVIRTRANASHNAAAVAAEAMELAPEARVTPTAAVGCIGQSDDNITSATDTCQRRRIPSRLVPWACDVCTLENAGAASKCEACGAKKPKQAAAAAAADAAAGVRARSEGVDAATADATPSTAVRRRSCRKKQQAELTPAGSIEQVTAAAAGEGVRADDADYVTAGAADEMVRTELRSVRGKRSTAQQQQQQQAAVDSEEQVADAQMQRQQQQPPALTPRSARYLARTAGRTQQQQSTQKQQQVTRSSPVQALQLPEPAADRVAVVAATADDALPVSKNRWSCTACTFDNAQTARKCKMCGTKKSAAAAAVTPAAGAGAAGEGNKPGQQSGRQRRISAATPLHSTPVTGTPAAAEAAAKSTDGDQWLPPASTEDQLQLAQQQQDLQHSMRSAAAGMAATAANDCGGAADESKKTQSGQQRQRMPEATTAVDTNATDKSDKVQSASASKPAAVAAAAAQASTEGTPVLAEMPSKARAQRRRPAATTAKQTQQQQQMPLTNSTKNNHLQQQRDIKPPTAPPSNKSSSQAQHAAAAAANSGLQYISWTSVPSSLADLAKSAVKRLSGFRLCIDGHEEGRVTHLLVGAERRTLKLLLGVANGAWLLKPEWLTDSLEKGAWQAVDDYTADIRFSPVAAAVRAALTAGTYRGPLAGKLVVVQCVAQSGGGFMSHAAAAEHKQSLQRLVRALGGRVCGARAAEVCVVCGASPVPRELPAAAVAVREEWLLQLAETHTGTENTREFEVERGV